MASNSIAFVCNVVKIDQILQKLKNKKHTDTYTDSTVFYKPNFFPDNQKETKNAHTYARNLTYLHKCVKLIKCFLQAL
jgi:ABC-type Fe3+ transport system substrate-binding protein